MDKHLNISMQIKGGLSPDGVVALLKAVGAGNIAVNGNTVTANVSERAVSHLKKHSAVESLSVPEETTESVVVHKGAVGPKVESPHVEHTVDAKTAGKVVAPDAASNIGGEKS